MKHATDIVPTLFPENAGKPADIGETPGYSIQDVCANCGNRAFVEMPGKPGLHPCPVCEAGKAQQRRILDLRFKQSQLPDKYRGVTLADWHKTLSPEEVSGKLLARAAMEEFVIRRGRVSLQWVLQRVPVDLPDALKALLEQPDDVRYGVSLYGAYGAGKTQLGAAAINTLRDAGVDAIYVRVQDIFSEARATWGKRDESDTEVISRYRDVDVLMIDDFNLTHDERDTLKPYERAYAEDLMRYRNAYHKPTIITCNVPPTKFVEQWGARSGEAVLEMLHWVKVGGVKLRKTAQPLGEVTL